MIYQISTFFAAACLLLMFHESAAQDYERTDERPAYLVGIHYGIGTPMGDLDERFGNHNAVGLSPAYMSPGGWLYGLKGKYIFGNTVEEENILQNLITERGFIIGNNRAPASVVLKQRGWSFHLTTSKLIDLAPSPARSGILVGTGLGVLWHKIRIQDDGNSAIQLFDPYDKGYDRLTGGPSFLIDLAYQHMSADRGLNFNVGINYTYARTESLRGFNYDTRVFADQKRNDHFFSFFASFILPIYGTTDPSKIYY